MLTQSRQESVSTGDRVRGLEEGACAMLLERLEGTESEAAEAYHQAHEDETSHGMCVCRRFGIGCEASLLATHGPLRCHSIRSPVMVSLGPPS